MLKVNYISISFENIKIKVKMVLIKCPLKISRILMVILKSIWTWALEKSWETAMPRAPSSSEFTVHCLKDLNGSVLEPQGLDNHFPSKGPVNVYVKPGSWGGGDDRQEQVTKRLHSPRGLLFSNISPQPLLSAPHCAFSSGGSRTVQEESQGIPNVVGGKHACGLRSWAAFRPWAGGLAQAKRALWAAPLVTGLRAAPISLAERVAPGARTGHLPPGISWDASLYTHHFPAIP